jgi:hypothetical protein
MACALRKSTKSGVDFEGSVGGKVQLGVASDSGGAIIIAVIYDGKSINSPWNVPLVAGNKLLTVLVDNPVPRDWTTIQELCGGGVTNTLLHFPFDPNGPTQSFRIEAS